MASARRGHENGIAGRTYDKRVGIGVDAEGGPVVDPTSNVLGLVSAAVQRQDDLREAESKFLAAALKHHK